MRIFLLLTLFLLIAPLHGQAQDEWQVITAENAAQLQEIRYLGNGKLMRAVAWSPDGRWIAAAGSIGIWVYDATNLAVVPFLLEGHSQPVMQLAFSPDGLTLVSSGYDGTIIIWDFGARTQRFVLETESQYPSSNWVHALEFRPDGVLATGHYGTIHFWDLTTGEEVDEPLELCNAYVTDITFNVDGSLIGCVGRELYGDTSFSYVDVWDISNDAAIALAEKPREAAVDSVQFSEDSSELIGTQVYCADCEGWLAWTWSLVDETLSVTETTIPLPDRFNEIPSGNWLYVEHSPDNSQFVYIEADILNVGDVQTGEVVVTPAFFVGNIHSVQVNFDGVFLAVENDEGVRLWNAQLGQILGDLVTALTFDPLNREIVAASNSDTNVQLVNLSLGQAFRTYATQSPTLSIQFSADGTVVAAHTEPVVCEEAECDTPNFYVWERETAAEIFTARIEYNFVYALSSDGSQLLSTDGLTTTLLDLASGESVPVPEVDNTLYQYINAMTFNPDDTLLAAGTGGGVLGGYLGASTLWEVGSEDAPELLEVIVESEDQTSGAAYAVDFNPDGTLLLDTSAQTLYRDNVVRVWDVASRELLVTLYGHHDQVTDALFSPDGRFIYSAGLDGTVRVWGMPAEPAS